MPKHKEEISLIKERIANSNKPKKKPKNKHKNKQNKNKINNKPRNKPNNNKLQENYEKHL